MDEIAEKMANDIDSLVRGHSVDSSELVRTYLLLGPRTMIKVLRELESSERIYREHLRAIQEGKILNCRIAHREIETFESEMKYGY
jgi:hypothetical protein